MQFGSDNIAPAHPAIMDAVARANEGDLPSYGTDQLTKRVQQRFSEVFERDVAVFFVPTGTAANALAISHFAGPGSLVLCHRAAHAYIDECGATEFFSGGAKMLPLDRNFFRAAQPLSAALGRLDDIWRAAREDLVVSRRADPTAIVRSREAIAMLATARWSLTAAQARQESRGMHRRTDHPSIDETAPRRLHLSGLDTIAISARTAAGEAAS